MKFDWYEATCEAGADEVIGEIMARAGQGMAHVQPHKGTTHGYERGYDVALGPQVLASVFYGGGAQGSGVHVRASGHDSIWWAELCREKFPQHQVTRVDVAEDYDAEDAWSTLSGLAADLARERGLRTQTLGDWVQGVEGRTLYVGSMKSPARLRVYEKGKQYAAMSMPGVSLDWTRVELMCRPRRRARYTLAKAAPAECYGLVSWSRALYRMLFALEITKIEDVCWRPADDDRSYRWCVKQFRPMFLRRAAMLGGMEAFGVQLLKDIAGAEP